MTRNLAAGKQQNMFVFLAIFFVLFVLNYFKSFTSAIIFISFFTDVSYDQSHDNILIFNSGVPRNFVRGEGVQEVQLRAKRRENGDLGTVAL
jgi:hypothetical protein